MEADLARSSHLFPISVAILGQWRQTSPDPERCPTFCLPIVAATAAVNRVNLRSMSLMDGFFGHGVKLSSLPLMESSSLSLMDGPLKSSNSYHMKDEVMKVQVALPFLPFDSQNLMPEEKLCAFLLPLSHLCKRSWGSANRATSIHLEKHYRDYGAKGALKTGKLSNYDRLDQILLKSMGMSTFALPNWLSDVVQVWSENRLHFSRQEPAFKDLRLGDNLPFPHRVIENYWLPSFSTNATAKDMMSDENRKITGTVEGGVCKLLGINLVENRTKPNLLPHAATSQPALHLLCR
ncbi:hypothetical protein ACLOJK_008280 [Asimina triloba]